MVRFGRNIAVPESFHPNWSDQRVRHSGERRTEPRTMVRALGIPLLQSGEPHAFDHSDFAPHELFSGNGDS